MENLKINSDNQFFVNRLTKMKMIVYQSFKYNNKIKKYEFYNKYENLKLGVQLCDFLNTDFHSFESTKAFIDKYSITTVAELSNIDIYRYYDKKDYENLIIEISKEIADELKTVQEAFIKDIEYIFNLNELEELNDLSPAKRLYILRGSKKSSNILKLYDSSKIKVEFNNFGDFTKFSITDEESSQEIAKHIQEDTLSPYSFTCRNIIQSFIIELFELALSDNIEIKQCKNCGKYFVPDNRSDEIYCSNIYESGKTCKEVGYFRTQQKLMKENDDLRIYRNVYQKLLLRTRRNPENDQYEKEFQSFKEKNIDLKEKLNKGKISQDVYMKWLNEQ